MNDEQTPRVQVLTIVAEISDGYQLHNLSEYFNLENPHPDVTVLDFSCIDSRFPDMWEDVPAVEWARKNAESIATND